ncbi:MAG: HD domain-containing protein [Treponema sp.]|jgi:HD-GYP domain-containing protein (c-di-GMP phosphodiesterase class II)|nr:HD domain-containing protein [Treponema sp.]
MDQLIVSIATALDFVEKDLLGASTNHGRRISVLCSAMGRLFGMNDDELRILTGSALLHDNALTEYIFFEHEGKQHDPAMKNHCIFGQRNIDILRFKGNARGVIYYHHERADGGGPFGRKEGEYPLMAELIAAADGIDVRNHLQTLGPHRLPLLQKEIEAETGKAYTHRAAGAMLDVLDEKMLFSLRDVNIKETTKQLLPVWREELEDQAIIGIGEFAARIIDFKSTFTRRHTSGIANIALTMARYYGFDTTERLQFYLAASLHDLGKLATPTVILEKPGPLTGDEFQIIKDHVRYTWEMLKDIEGFEKICMWASCHHEKLDGSGYPFGKKAEDLDRNSRLLCCIDIYQAVSEERPYHSGRSHEETIKILKDMAERGFVDSKIVEDLDKVLAG